MAWEWLCPLTHLAEDLQAEFDARDGAFSKLYIVLFHTGFHLVILMRLQSLLRRIPAIGPALARVLFVMTSLLRGCEISPTATIGPGFRVGHPLGIVIGSHVRAGRNLTVMHNVTLGGRRNVWSPQPAAQSIGDNVTVGTGAVVLGNVTIGDNVAIGANALVLNDVPADCIAITTKAYIMQKP